MIWSNQCSFYAKIHKQENKQSNSKPTKTTILKRQVGHQRRPFKAGIAFDDVRCSNEIFLREREKEILKRMPSHENSLIKSGDQYLNSSEGKIVFMMQRLEREIIHGGLILLITADFCTTKSAVIFLFPAPIVFVRQRVSDVNWVILCVFQLMQINKSIHRRSRRNLYRIPYTRKDKNSLLYN